MKDFPTTASQDPIMGLVRSLSCPNMKIEKQGSLRRRHSWNGLSFHEKQELEQFSLREGDNENEDKYARYLRKARAVVVGGGLVAAGIVMIPLPGPGIVALGAGATVLANEFPAAQRAMNSAKESTVGKAAQRAMDSVAARVNGGGKAKKSEEEATKATGTSKDTTTTTSPETNGTEARDDNDDGKIGYKQQFHVMSKTLEDGFYKGFAKAYIGTKKAYKTSKKLVAERVAH